MDTYAMNQGIEELYICKDRRLLEIIVNKNLHELLSKPEKMEWNCTFQSLAQSIIK